MTPNRTAHTGSVTAIPAGTGEWKEYHGEVYRCRVYLMPATSGGFVATVPGLPGVHGAGATESETLAAVTQALRAHGKRPAPESQTEAPPAGAAVRWVVVYP
jgi:predicted RNase H-like HicB family nuclease